MEGIKSQDIGLMLKLISLEKQEAQVYSGKGRMAWPDDWRDWEEEEKRKEDLKVGEPTADQPYSFSGASLNLYAVRNIEATTGISKSQVSGGLRRCLDLSLVRRSRRSGAPRVNRPELMDFIVYGLKYSFPAKQGELVRGIRTAFAAPVLEKRIFSAGELVPVWQEPRGKSKGLSVEPLFKSIGKAVRNDQELYALLALVDAIRIGGPRESNLAIEQLKRHMEVT